MKAKLTAAELAQAEFQRDARSTLQGGVRLDDLRALATTDEEPFELATAQQKVLWRIERWRSGRIVDRWLKSFGAGVLALACSAPGARWMLLEREEVRGGSRVCIYEDGFGAYAETVPVWAVCEPWVEVEE